MGTILLILNRDQPVAATLEKIKTANIKKVFICPIDYRTEAMSQAILSLLKQEASIVVESVNFRDEFNRKAFELKRDYIDFIRTIGETQFDGHTNLRQYFNYPGEDFSVWWFSLISEKSPYKTHAFTHYSKVIALLHLKHDLQCQQIWMTGDDQPLDKVLLSSSQAICLFPTRSLAPWKEDLKTILIEFLRAGRFLFFLFKRIWGANRLSAQFKNYKNRIKDCEVAIVTAFPSVNKEKLKEGIFVNSLYGSLPKSFADHNKKIAWLGMYAPIHNSSWEETVETAAQVKKIDLFFLVEEWLSIKDFFKIAGNYLRISFRCLKRIKQYRKLFLYKDQRSGESVNFWDILRKDFFSSFLGKVLVWGITDYMIFLRNVENLPPQTKILYFAELQAWEKALNLACAKRKDILCIGLQHTIVPLLYMSYFEHPEDLKNDNFLTSSPMPDYLGCVGSITKDILLRNGFPQEKLFILGGFRFADFKKKANGLPDGKNKKNQIVVAFANCAWENEEVMWMIYEAFKNEARGWTFLLKSHPCCPMEVVVQRLGFQLDPNMYQFTNKNLNEIVPESKAMIVKESSSIFWALHHRIPAIVPMLYNIVDICPLSGVKDIPIVVKTPQELFEAVQKAMQDQEGVRKEEEEFVRQYFDVFTDDKQYYLNLQSCFK